jgi:hypothetical protein
LAATVVVALVIAVVPEDQASGIAAEDLAEEDKKIIDTDNRGHFMSEEFHNATLTNSLIP